MRIIITTLQHYKTQSEQLEARYQHFISEMIMLRLSQHLKVVADIAFKLAAGAEYISGRKPMIAVQASRMAASKRAIFTHGRQRPVQYLKWTKAKYIRESVQHVISPNETFVTSAQTYGSIIEEMRKVRNVLAHKTTSAKTDFRALVRQLYGANVNISAGAFLTTTRRTPICKLK